MSDIEERVVSYASQVGKFCGMVDVLDAARRIEDREWMDETITKLIEYVRKLDEERGE